ncbi:hypothetical protein ACQ4PT_067107 [Festuca glaucescens]
MEVPDVIRSGAVCSSWRVAHRVRCAYACDAFGADAAALHSPPSRTTFRLTFPGPPSPPHSVAGSEHGWLFMTNQAANPYLLNPLTGARAALPLVSTLERVKSSFFNGVGDVLYSVDHDQRP